MEHPLTLAAAARYGRYEGTISLAGAVLMPLDRPITVGDKSGIDDRIMMPGNSCRGR